MTIIGMANLASPPSRIQACNGRCESCLNRVKAEVKGTVRAGTPAKTSFPLNETLDIWLGEEQ